MKKIKNGLFITIEGGEGSGKTTLAKNLYEKYKKEDFDVILTREPGGNEIAEQIRNIIVNNDIDIKTQILLFTAVRRIHCKDVILPALKNNKMVICDRYVTSSLVYQGLVGGLSIEEIMRLQKLAIYDNGVGVIPDVEFILDVNAKKGLERIKNRTTNNIYDAKSIEYHESINNAFKNIKSIANKTHHIDANLDESFVLTQVGYHIDNIIDRHSYEKVIYND